MKELETSLLHRAVYTVFTVVLLAFVAGPSGLAHSPNVDSSLDDWCVGAFSNTAPGGGRTEDTAVTLTCGECSFDEKACNFDSDCTQAPNAQTCINLTSKTEVAFWDNRTDGAVNDLGTVAITQDDTNLYIAAELWVDPDPVSLPFGQIAIDYTQGGINVWHDPESKMGNPGRCSVSTDRACTSDADCHFCAISTEPFPSTRLRTCGSGCDPLNAMDVCGMTETCQGAGSLGVLQGVGVNTSPVGAADYLLLFDFSLWLIGAEDAVILAEPTASGNPAAWIPALDSPIRINGWGATAWDPVFGGTCRIGGAVCTDDATCDAINAGDVCVCAADFVGDGVECDFAPAVNPGASGGSGGPPGSVEVAIPWEAFGCTGSPGAFSCPGFGPGVPFRFTMSVSRGTTSLNFSPDGAHEDLLSEAVAGATTTSEDSCPGMGVVTTDCELADGSIDSFIPRMPPLLHESTPGGRTQDLLLDKLPTNDVMLDWAGSCSLGDNDYSVYEGTIGSWTDHIPLPGLCSTGMATDATFGIPVGDVYYLVVPHDGSNEGSYGGDDITGERPVSLMPCRLQSLGLCQ